ncbi:MAG: LVIVD repeat-containing protein [Gaiellaceae bacterium]
MRSLAAIVTAFAVLALGAAEAFACELHSGSATAPTGVSAVAALFPSAWATPAPLVTQAPAAGPLVTPYRLRLVGHADPHQGYTADVSYLRGHAYLSSYGGAACPSDGVRVYDLARPSRPAHVSTFASGAAEPEVGGSWTEKTIVQHVATPAFTGDLAVTSFQHCRDNAFRGFGLYDVTDPRAPRRLALVATDVRGSHEIWLQPRTGAAYVYTAVIDAESMTSPDYDPTKRVATTPGHPDFRIYDVSNPAAPVEVGSWGAWQELGIPPHVSGVDRFVHSVRSNAAGTRAYLSYWDLGTVILDTTDAAQPRYLGRTQPSDNTHSAAFAQSGSVLVETHETGGGLPTFYDVSKPARPRRLGQLSIPAATQPVPEGSSPFMNGVHDADVSKNRAFFSWYQQGVIAADISKPSRPAVLAQFLPFPAADPNNRLCPAGACRVVWGVAIAGPYVLASDMVSGLYVLQLEKKSQPKH